MMVEVMKISGCRRKRFYQLSLTQFKKASPVLEWGHDQRLCSTKPITSLPTRKDRCLSAVRNHQLVTRDANR